MGLPKCVAKLICDESEHSFFIPVSFYFYFQLDVTLIMSAVNVVACLGLGSTKIIVGHKLESRALITDSK